MTYSNQPKKTARRRNMSTSKVGSKTTKKDGHSTISVEDRASYQALLEKVGFDPQVAAEVANDLFSTVLAAKKLASAA